MSPGIYGTPSNGLAAFKTVSPPENVDQRS
jgi:hypothetical protein